MELRLLVKWQMEHPGQTLDRQWVCLKWPTGTRYVYTSAFSGPRWDPSGTSSSVLPSGAQIAETFVLDPTQHPVTDHLDALTGGLSPTFHPELYYGVTCALTTARIGSLPVAEFFTRAFTESKLHIDWSAPLDAAPQLIGVLYELRDSLMVDGLLTAMVGTSLDIWHRVACSGLQDDEVLRVAGPLARGGHQLIGNLLAETVAEAIERGRLHDVLDVFHEYCFRVSEGISLILDSSDLEEFYDAIYQAMPFAIGADDIGDFLIEQVRVPDPNLRLRSLHNVVQENRVRMADAVLVDVWNVTLEDIAWNAHVAGVREAGTRGVRAAQRLARGLTNKYRLYPRVMIPQLLAEAGVLPLGN